MGKILRTGALLLGLGSMTGCEGCDKNSSPPATEAPRPATGSSLATHSPTTGALAPHS